MGSPHETGRRQGKNVRQIKRLIENEKDIAVHMTDIQRHIRR